MRALSSTSGQITNVCFQAHVVSNLGARCEIMMMAVSLSCRRSITCGTVDKTDRHINCVNYLNIKLTGTSSPPGVEPGKIERRVQTESRFEYL